MEEKRPAEAENIKGSDGGHSIRQPFPTWGDMLAMLGIFLAASLVAGLIMIILRSLAPGLETAAVNAAAYFIQFGAAIAGICAYRGLRGGGKCPFRFTFRWYNASMVLLGLVLLVATSVVIDPLLNLFPDRYFEMLNDMIGTGGWAVLLTVLLAPVLEEMLFRGQILEAARQRWGPAKAIMISAAVFGLVHFTCPPQMVNAFVMGIVMGYIYVLTGSLMPVILIHAANNTIAYLTMEFTGSQTTDLRSLVGSDVWYYIIYGASLVVFIASMVSMAVIAAGKGRAAKSGEEYTPEGNNRQ